ncbi:MAG: Aminomethyltransferase [Firmicutes bacterium]|nr:Aminomethyltransferase [Bacillota bacterium]
MTAKPTPLYQTHIKYGGRMVEFGGWLLPVQYTGIKEEHYAVRKRAGLFDVSHMGEVAVQGPDALRFLQHLVTNNVGKLVNQQVLYTPMCYLDGGTVDDLLVYKKEDNKYLLVINAANIEKDCRWIKENAIGFDVICENISDQVAQLALQGPLAETILARLTTAPLAELNYYWFWPEIEVAGKKVLLSRTGYTGEAGFELYCQPEEAASLWDDIMTSGAEDGILPTGLGCRDTLRFEAGLPLYGHELSEVISPIEAGLGIFVKFDKGDFNGRQSLYKAKSEGPARKIVGFEMVERGVARAEYPVLLEGRRIGVVTTGSYAPSLDKNLGLALIEAEYANVGQQVDIQVRGKNVAAQIISKPFYRREGK